MGAVWETKSQEAQAEYVTAVEEYRKTPQYKEFEKARYEHEKEMAERRSKILGNLNRKVPPSSRTASRITSQIASPNKPAPKRAKVADGTAVPVKPMKDSTTEVTAKSPKRKPQTKKK